MLILLDQDNVLADFKSGFRRHWRGRFGEDAPIEGKEHIFYIRDRLPEHLRPHAAELYGAVGFFESLPSMPGAVEAAHALLAAGHDVRSVPRRSTNTATAPARKSPGWNNTWVRNGHGA